MPELKEFVIPQADLGEPAKNKKQVSTLVFLVLVLLGLLLVYWVLTRPTTIVNSRPTRGISNVFSIYGINREDFLSSPNSVFVAKNGDIYVADTGNHRVVVFDSRGRYKSKIDYKVKKRGEGEFVPGDLVTPLGVTVDDRGRVYTASLDSGVMVFDRDGKKIRHLPIPSIQLHTRGEKVYLTTLGSVYGLNSRGDIVQHIGTKGRRLGQFESPQDLTIDNKGNIIVSDSQNMRLQKLNKKGDVVAFMGTPPKSLNDSKRLFGLGTGVTIDDQGRIYIADAFHHAIRIFDKDGNDLGEIGDQGDADGNFNYPSDIFYMGGNTFAVADKWNDRVQIIRINPGEARPAGTESKAASMGLPRWALVMGILILLALILLTARRYMVKMRYRPVLPS